MTGPDPAGAGTGGRRSWIEMIMGLPISIHRRGKGPEAFVERIFGELRAVDAMFSPFLSRSVLSRFRRGEIALTDLPSPFLSVLEQGTTYRELTAGAFDLYASGRLDPCGIVKGWAAQRAARWLPADAYLGAGGDIAVRSSGFPWRIGIEHPLDPSGLLTVLSLRNAAVATSGSAHRGAHIIDPGTGCPSTGLMQATVVGPALTEADVWATAVIARGTRVLDRADPLLSRLTGRGYDALVVTDDGQIIETENLGRYLAADVAMASVWCLPAARPA